ncbi:MAG TPA: 30S ribosomal protein S2 [Candidatus Methylacidiphilales bacterium]|nr:30S ribosomal protein S2 [Candidatus Methylacidiphilales bacterium]
MNRVDIKDLLDAGVHFGHRTQRWNPKMKPFIFEARNGIYVINLEHTVKQLETAQDFLVKVAGGGKRILFVGCKKQAQETIKELAQRSNSFYVTERWLGGTLTNLATIRKSVARMKYIDGLETSGEINKLPKQEIAVLRRENTKLHRNLDGIKDMDKFPAAIIIIDVPRESIAVAEARRLNIPVVAITDTNSDPDLADFPIAGNDDAIRSISIILEALNDAIIEGAAGSAHAAPESAKTAEEESLTGVSA